MGWDAAKERAERHEHYVSSSADTCQHFCFPHSSPSWIMLMLKPCLRNIPFDSRIGRPSASQRGGENMVGDSAYSGYFTDMQEKVFVN